MEEGTSGSVRRTEREISRFAGDDGQEVNLTDDGLRTRSRCSFGIKGSVAGSLSSRWIIMEYSGLEGVSTARDR